MINGGNVTVTGGDGGSNSTNEGLGGDGGDAFASEVNINGGNVTATGGKGGNATSYGGYGGYGIFSPDAVVKVNGGNVIVSGGIGAAGQSANGGGSSAVYAAIEVNGGDITMLGGDGGVAGAEIGNAIDTDGSLKTNLGAYVGDNADNATKIGKTTIDKGGYYGNQFVRVKAEEENVDKSGLKAALDEAATLSKEITGKTEYADIAEKLEKAVSAAQEVYDDGTATQDETDAAEKKLREALASIKEDIAEIDAENSVPTARENLVYTGKPQTLISAGTGSVPMAYRVEGMSDTYSKSIPTATNAGEYTVYYKRADFVLMDESSNADVTESSLKVTIAQAALTVKADSKSKEYGDKDPELTYKATGLLNNDRFTGKLERRAGEDVGSYNITQGTLSAGDNYAVDFTGARFVINRKSISNAEVSLEKSEFEYDSLQHKPVVSRVTLGATVLSESDYTVDDIASGAGVSIGEYTVTVRGKGNYSDYASTTYRIADSLPVVSEIPTASTIKEGDALSESKLSGGSANVSGKFVWKDDTIVPDAAESDVREFEVWFIPDDENYDPVTVMVKVTVIPVSVMFSSVNNTDAGKFYADAEGLNDMFGGMEVAVGENLELELSVKDERIAEALPAFANAKEAIQGMSAAKDKSLDFFALELKKITTDYVSGDVKESTSFGSAANIIDISFLLYDTKDKKDISILRYAGGKAEEITLTPNSEGEYMEIGADGVLVIHIKEMGVYAVSYATENSEPEEPDTPVTPDTPADSDKTDTSTDSETNDPSENSEGSGSSDTSKDDNSSSSDSSKGASSKRSSSSGSSKWASSKRSSSSGSGNSSSKASGRATK